MTAKHPTRRSMQPRRPRSVGCQGLPMPWSRLQNGAPSSLQSSMPDILPLAGLRQLRSVGRFAAQVTMNAVRPWSSVAQRTDDRSRPPLRLATRHHERVRWPARATLTLHGLALCASFLVVSACVDSGDEKPAPPTDTRSVSAPPRSVSTSTTSVIRGEVEAYVTQNASGSWSLSEGARGVISVYLELGQESIGDALIERYGDAVSIAYGGPIRTVDG